MELGYEERKAIIYRALGLETSDIFDIGQRRNLTRYPRGSGRTTRLAVHAIVLASMGQTVIVQGHTQSYTNELYHKIQHMIYKLTCVDNFVWVQDAQDNVMKYSPSLQGKADIWLQDHHYIEQQLQFYKHVM